MFRIVGFLVLSLAVAGCVPEQKEHGITLGAFLAVDRIESGLTRGVSTKADVERLLGKPDGRGAAFMALTDQAIAKLIKAGQSGPRDQREMWFYEDQTANILDAKDGYMRLRLRQQMLMVYFHRERFDGFMWFSSAGMGRAADPVSVKP